ncbi:M56 family metallopeptidase [Streptomyces sp. PCS3-D2]|uniref:M56 family metallopeptidase n=1 Tax=Streptomyces sp. PCS3-D2 TaxID=1460244 RepID=UPI0004536C5A|nr:M56 family metallopeptidase [Streptomyces sp. PCS3-D2]WKV75897.1 M56 family metallopeptidase [Streptomyces sp. PCS3-D2]
MGVFVFLPLVLPLTAWPIARLAEQHLHPRTATGLLTAVAAVLACCSTLCLALVMVVGTAQLPGNPLPDSWSDPEVREAVPYDEVAGRIAIPALLTVLTSCSAAVWRQHRIRRRTEEALRTARPGPVAVLPDEAPYAYALPGRGLDRVVVSTGMLAALTSRERRALFAHERAHLSGRHHRFLLTVRLAAHANPFLLPLRTAVAYTCERWADEEAAARIGSRRTVARAIGKAALVSPGGPPVAAAHFAMAGPVPRRVAALLGPAPAGGAWPPAFTRAGLAVWTAAGGATASALSSANAAVTLYFILHAATFSA